MSVESHTQFMQVIEINVYTVKWGWPTLFRKGNAASVEVPIVQEGKVGLVESSELKKKKIPSGENNKRGSKKK